MVFDEVISLFAEFGVLCLHKMTLHITSALHRPKLSFTLQWIAKCSKWLSFLIWFRHPNLSTFLFYSGGPAVLARHAEDGGGVRCHFVPALVPQRMQCYQRGLLRGPGPAVRHHLLQNIQGHFTSRSEIRGWTPLQVREHALFFIHFASAEGLG